MTKNRLPSPSHSARFTSVIDDIWKSPLLSKNEVMLYLAVMSHLWKVKKQNIPTDVFWASKQTLATLARLSPRTVQRLLRKWQEKNWLTVYKADPFQSVYYRFHPDRMLDSVNTLSTSRIPSTTSSRTGSNTRSDSPLDSTDDSESSPVGHIAESLVGHTEPIVGQNTVGQFEQAGETTETSTVRQLEQPSETNATSLVGHIEQGESSVCLPKHTNRKHTNTKHTNYSKHTQRNHTNWHHPIGTDGTVMSLDNGSLQDSVGGYSTHDVEDTRDSQTPSKKAIGIAEPLQYSGSDSTKNVESFSVTNQHSTQPTTVSSESPSTSNPRISTQGRMPKNHQGTIPPKESESEFFNRCLKGRNPEEFETQPVCEPMALTADGTPEWEYLWMESFLDFTTTVMPDRIQQAKLGDAQFMHRVYKDSYVSIARTYNIPVWVRDRLWADSIFKRYFTDVSEYLTNLSAELEA